MKRSLSIFIACVVAVSAIAGDAIYIAMPNVWTGATCTVTSAPINGFIDNIWIDSQGATATTTVRIATSEEVILGLTGVTADGKYRPRIGVGNTNGVGVTSASNSLERFLLVNEPVVITVTTTLGTNQTYYGFTNIIRFDDK